MCFAWKCACSASLRLRNAKKPHLLNVYEKRKKKDKTTNHSNQLSHKYVCQLRLMNSKSTRNSKKPSNRRRNGEVLTLSTKCAYQIWKLYAIYPLWRGFLPLWRIIATAVYCRSLIDSINAMSFSLSNVPCSTHASHQEIGAQVLIQVTNTNTIWAIVIIDNAQRFLKRSDELPVKQVMMEYFSSK